MSASLAVLFSSLVATSAPSTPTAMTPVESAAFGALVGGVTGGVVLGAGTFAAGIAISNAQCRAGCIDSDGTAFIIGTPYAAALGLIVGAVSGGVIGVLLAADESEPGREQCGTAIVGICPASRWCI